MSVRVHSKRKVTDCIQNAKEIAGLHPIEKKKRELKNIYFEVFNGSLMVKIDYREKKLWMRKINRLII